MEEEVCYPPGWWKIDLSSKSTCKCMCKDWLISSKSPFYSLVTKAKIKLSVTKKNVIAICYVTGWEK